MKHILAAGAAHGDPTILGAEIILLLAALWGVFVGKSHKKTALVCLVIAIIFIAGYIQTGGTYKT